MFIKLKHSNQGIFLKRLKKNSSLENLNFSDNDFGDEAVKLLAIGIIENRSLKHLKLKNCLIYD